jgi:hypothetical protein
MHSLSQRILKAYRVLAVTTKADCADAYALDPDQFLRQAVIRNLIIHMQSLTEDDRRMQEILTA